MDILKKIFPLSFKEKNGVAGLVINILIQLVAFIVIGAVIGIVVSLKLPLITWIVSTIGSLLGLYFVAGIVLACLDYFKILK